MQCSNPGSGQMCRQFTESASSYKLTTENNNKTKKGYKILNRKDGELILGFEDEPWNYWLPIQYAFLLYFSMYNL